MRETETDRKMDRDVGTQIETVRDRERDKSDGQRPPSGGGGGKDGVVGRRRQERGSGSAKTG